MFTVTVFEILLYEGRLLLSPTQRGAGNERVKQEKYIYIKRKKTEKQTLVINTLRVYWVIILGESGCYVFA